MVRPGIVKEDGAAILMRTTSVSLRKKEKALMDKEYMRIVVKCRGNIALCVILMRSNIANENKFT